MWDNWRIKKNRVARGFSRKDATKKNPNQITMPVNRSQQGKRKSTRRFREWIDTLFDQSDISCLFPSPSHTALLYVYDCSLLLRKVKKVRNSILLNVSMSTTSARVRNLKCFLSFSLSGFSVKVISLFFPFHVKLGLFAKNSLKRFKNYFYMYLNILFLHPL